MSESNPTFAIMGSGGVGGYFGARIAQAGYPVTFIARGAHLAAIRQNGLTVEGPVDDFRVMVEATDSPVEVGPVDCVLFCVKLWDTETAADICKPMIGTETAVISLQNGVESEDILGGIIGRPHTMGGVAEIAVSVSRPGVIHKLSPFHRIRFGEMDGRVTDRARVLEQCLSTSNIQVDLSDRIPVDIWIKFVLLVGVSALTALTRRPVGEVRGLSDTRALLREVMEETTAVARAKSIELPEDIVSTRIAMVDALPHDMFASMAIDLRQGRRLELPWLSGAVVRLGEELGVPTPTNRFVNTSLLLHVDGA